jgi:hypothetical protein
MKMKFLREPLFHFLIIGTVIFLLFSIVNREEDTVSGNKIVVTASDIERLSDTWSRKWNRPPTEQELSGLIEAHIREEVYYREALALGLDRNDTILRRRLMQKMEFLSNDLAELSTPDETALNQFLLENQDRYELPARVSFTHIYFSGDKRGAKAESGAKRVLSALESASGTVIRAPDRGDSFMLGYDFTRETPSEVARLFGSGFADRLFKSDRGAWQGPIESGYGIHLVRISEMIDSRMPELIEVIEEVRRDWMFEQRKKTNEEIYRRLKERYEIVVEETSEQSGIARAAVPGGGTR